MIYDKFIYGSNTAGYFLTAFLVFIILLFVMSIVWQCIKRGLVNPFMRRGWLSSFDLDTIADQLVVEVTDYQKEKRKIVEGSTVNLSPDTSTAHNISQDISEILEKTRDDNPL